MLRPAAFHCHHATDIQAFHLGVHRALKGQHHITEKVRQAWNTHKDRLRGIAILGARLSSQFNKDRRFNYNDKELIEAFDRAVASYNGFTQP